jgi:hypothetical protein
MIKSRRIRWAGHVALMVRMRSAYSILIGKPERKRHLGRPRYRCEGNIKMNLKERKWEGMDWINLAQDRDRRRARVSTVPNEPSGSVKGG